jgi:hypothetical protein
MVHRQDAAKHSEDGNGKSQQSAHVLTNTAQRALFEAAAGGFYFGN